MYRLQCGKIVGLTLGATAGLWLLVALLSGTAAARGIQPSIPTRDVVESAAQQRTRESGDQRGALRRLNKGQRRLGQVGYEQGEGPNLMLSVTVGLDPHSCDSFASVIHVGFNTRVTYCYSVRNTGTETITHHTIDDDPFGEVLSATPFVLPPDTTAQLTITRSITETVLNTGRWSALDESGAALVTALARAKVYVDELIVESGFGRVGQPCRFMEPFAAEAGSSLFLCHKLSNRTDLTLTHHTLVDGSVGTVLDDAAYELRPGEEISLLELGAAPVVTSSLTQSFHLSRTVRWDATFSTLPPELGDSALSSPDIISTTTTRRSSVRIASLRFAYTFGFESGTCGENTDGVAFVGSAIVLCYSVINTGDITLTHHRVVDDYGGFDQIIFEHTKDLAPGEPFIFTTVQQVVTTTRATGRWIGFTADPRLNEEGTTSTTASGQITVTARDAAQLQVVVFNDADQNGEQGEAESGLPDVEVIASREPDTAVRHRTNADGVATFVDLFPGVYEIGVDPDAIPFYSPLAGEEPVRLLVRSGDSNRLPLAFVRLRAPIPWLYLPLWAGL